MYLSREEEAVYQGERGETLRRMMEILVALGDIYGAERLVPVKSVQIAGVSYKNIGEAGLEWISDLQGCVVVPSILNPAGMDLCRWQEMGVSEDFAEKQQQTIEAYRRLGITIDCTCTPYQIYQGLAGPGDHLAWSESSAVSYANSVIGARTNREGGPSALAAALVGKTALYGYHLDENRLPTHLVEVEADLHGSDYGALGFLVGRIVKDGVPFFRLPGQRPSPDELKALGAAMAASGSVALYYVQDVTPRPPAGGGQPEETLHLDRKEIAEVYARFPAEGADAVALGCPHCSAEELERIAGLLQGQKVQKELWVCTARKIAEANPGRVAAIEKSGAHVFCDTCMVVSPATERFSRMLTCSGKALSYLPGLAGVKAGLGSLEDCINAALGRQQ
ncbi:MAG: aconitase X catalytic domain-containing protein [Methanothrix sp.]|nr:aconitase X catalytic domain-containing protein [Methanothrix sp.]